MVDVFLQLSLTSMREVTKSKKIWAPEGLELRVLKGTGIDIGSGGDPVFPYAQSFDQENGDANYITKYVHDTFDFVYSSHCLEHIYDPKKTILEWWKLVKPGGHLFVTVPDEDLYEQGVFPSRFNPDHKVTFTISKTKSWSPVSINVYDLVKTLPNGEILSLTLQDHGYDRSLMTFGKRLKQGFFIKQFIKVYFGIKNRLGLKIKSLERFFLNYQAIDQTTKKDTLAQIQCIVKKKI